MLLIRSARKKARPRESFPTNQKSNEPTMKLTQKIKEQGALGYMLLWLIGIPIPILLVIFLLRGCT
jgi:hypothetical protein